MYLEFTSLVSKETHPSSRTETLSFYSIVSKEQSAAPSRLGVPRRSSPSVSAALATETTPAHQPRSM